MPKKKFKRRSKYHSPPFGLPKKKEKKKKKPKYKNLKNSVLI
jgi:hypothetical protein